jgi:hypothetical protein
MRRAWVLLMLASCTPAPVEISRPIVSEAGLAPTLLQLHNRERGAFGSPPVAWDPALAAAARGYAGELAALGMLRHSPKQARVGQGENLWIGTRGAFPLEAMAASWAGEKAMFRPGRFPDVSRNGNWAAVGPYTQMVWPGTSRIGCGLASSARWDVLVCRYAPAGNVTGVMLAPR